MQNLNNRLTTLHRDDMRALRAGVRAVLGGSAMAASLLLAGCSGALSPAAGGTGSTTTSALKTYTGRVFGGQQPIAGSTIQLWTVGTTGNRSASTALIASTVTTDANGNFSITGQYNCASATQVYITATGGNPGGGVNGSVSVAAALGACTSLTPSTFILMNEVTTVAAAYGLAPFAADMTHIGSTGSNPSGLVNAFANAGLIASSATGLAGAAVPAGVTVPVAEINTLANILASCVNTAGAASAQCTQLFTATGATDTFDAAFAIAKNPGTSAVTALYALNSPTAPFQPSQSSQPNDFTLAASATGGGVLASPRAVALDGSGNAWVANGTGTTVTELSPTGALLANPAPAGLVGAQGVAVDRAGNVWIANTAGNTAVKLTLAAGAVSTSASYTAGISGPRSVAIDSGNNAWFANQNGNSVAAFTAAGAALSGSPFTGDGNLTVPGGIAVALDGSILVTSGNGYVERLTNAGAYSSTLSDNALQGPTAVAVNTNNQVVATGFTTGSAVAGALGEYTTLTTASSVSPVGTGVSTPLGVATDNTSFFVTNGGSSGSLAQFVVGSATPVSPTAGYGSLNTPAGVAVDSSGSVWTANAGANTVSKFIGLANPVTTPLAANVGP